MKRLVPALALLLAACGSNLQSMDVQKYFAQNPLAAEEAATALGQVYVSMIVDEKAELEKNDLFDEVDGMRVAAGKAIEDATRERKNGLLGQFIPHKQFTRGFVLVRPKDGIIFTGTTFESAPGPDLHLFASELSDPREGVFPDDSAVDLGLMGYTYGPQTMTFDATLWNDNFRSLIIYDVKLKRLYGFAQIGPQI